MKIEEWCRMEAMAYQRARGDTLQSIGERFGLCKERTRQLLLQRDRLTRKHARLLDGVRDWLECLTPPAPEDPPRS